MKTKQLLNGWKNITLKEISLEGKGEYGSGGSAVDYDETKPRYIRITDIDENGRLKDDSKVSSNIIETKYLLEEEDLLFARSGSVGKTYLHQKENSPAIFAGYLIRFKLDKTKVLPKYIFLFTKSKKYHSWIKAKSESKTMTMSNINAKEYSELKIPIPFKDGKPDLETQKKIVQILEQAEQLKQKRGQADKLIDDYLKSVFNEMFNKYFKDKKKFKKINFFCIEDKNAIKAGPFGSSLKKEIYVARGYKIYGQEQVIRDDFKFGDYYISEEKYEELKNYKIKEGDVLISLVGTYGKISIVPKDFEPGIINPRLMKISFDNSKMLPIFFKYLFLSPFIRSQLERVSHGGTMDIVNVGLIKALDFPDIPIKLQQKFTSMVEKIEEIKKKQNKNKEEIDNLFNALMQNVFKGELI
jgi:type I restriction enzyme S subunit